MAVTITPVVDLDNVPPRVRVTFTDTNTTRPTASVRRRHPDGSEHDVRTPAGTVLYLQGGTGMVYDYEAPMGVPVVYFDPEGTFEAAPVTVDDGQVWLIHPGDPELSMPVEFRKGALEETNNAANVGMFEVLGRSTPVSISDGQRKSDASTLIIGVDTPAEVVALRALLRDSSALWLSVPPALGLGVQSSYIQPLDVQWRRRSEIGSDPHRDVTIPYRVVSMPVGGALSQRTFADLLVEHEDFASIAALQDFAALLD